MRILVSLLAVAALILLVFLGVEIANLRYLFGVIIPYAAVAAFIFGVMYRVVKWSRSPVPFRIPTTGGQQKSLPWINYSKLDNPSTNGEVIKRMALEVLMFRSLFRNTKSELKEGPRLAHGSEKILWLAGLAFHYSFLIILLRHFRFFTVPVPLPVKLLESMDSFFQVGVPLVYMTDIIIVAAATYLFLRRVVMPQIRYISLPSDYFPLFLILSVAVSGAVMRYFIRVDVVGVKELTMGLVSFSPKIPAGIGAIFYIHLFLVSTLIAYIPVSKIMHMGGVFLSPTRNLANNNRMKRHINPWNYPVHVHTYEEYEDDFREKMKKAGIPVEKE
jgi:[DsrC]-trisulfide reductase subunit M